MYFYEKELSFTKQKTVKTVAMFYVFEKFLNVWLNREDMDFISSSAFYVWRYHMPWCFWKIPLREWEWERQKVSKYYCENSFDPMDPWKYSQRFPLKESKTLSFK